MTINAELYFVKIFNFKREKRVIGRLFALSKASVSTRSQAAMMNTLLESRPRKKRATGGTVFSVILHAGIVFLAVFATARAGVVKDDTPRAQKVDFVKTAEPPKPVEKKPDT